MAHVMMRTATTPRKIIKATVNTVIPMTRELSALLLSVPPIVTATEEKLPAPTVVTACT